MAPTAPADAAIDRLRDMPGLREAPVDRRAEPGATFGGVGDPDPDGPVPRVLAEIDAGVAAFDRRTGRLVRGSGDPAAGRGPERGLRESTCGTASGGCSPIF